MAKQIKITSRMRSCNEEYEESFFRRYMDNGILQEKRVLSNECDYGCASYVRTSADKGKTWSDWVTEFQDTAEEGRHGKLPESPDGDELLDAMQEPVYDPISGCYVSVGSSFYYLYGHAEGLCVRQWDLGEDNFRMHAYYKVRYPDGREERKMFEFDEGGTDYDPAKYRDPNFLDKNRCGAGDLFILPDGDLCFNLFPYVPLCCRLAGVDVNQYFPSSPNLHHGLIIARAHWNAEKGEYEFSYSNPIMLSDVESSRCVMEPHMAILPNGRWILVVRGSNYKNPAWNPRVNPGTPGFKWFSFSDDNGKTFSPLMPWFFDTREVVYSPAAIHQFYRSKKNGKLYWIGNISDNPSTIDSNGPRYPLNICQVDEEYGFLIKDTLAVIDGLREGQTDVELSNFNLLEDPDTGDLEIRMTKININGAAQGGGRPGDWYSEAWEYFVDFD